MRRAGGFPDRDLVGPGPRANATRSMNLRRLFGKQVDGSLKTWPFILLGDVGVIPPRRRRDRRVHLSDRLEEAADLAGVNLIDQRWPLDLRGTFPPDGRLILGRRISRRTARLRGSGWGNILRRLVDQTGGLFLGREIGLARR